MIKKLIPIVLILALFGCSAKHIKVQKNFWDKSDVKIGVALVEPNKAGAYKEGNQGLLDIVINTAMAGSLDAHLQTLTISDFEKIKDIFVDRLKTAGYNAKKIDENVDIKSLPKYSKKSSAKNKFKKDLSTFVSGKDIDILVLFSVDRFGTVRSYYGFIPLGSPKALFDVSGQMVDLSSNEQLWYVEQDDKKAAQKVLGDWDQSPDFPNVTKSIQTAVENAIEFLEDDFFRTKKN